MKNKRKILIAEDELLIAKVLRMQLEKEGFEVDNVADGNDAFNKVKQMQPDIIILDMHLKNNTSGHETGKKIRQAGINTPIIFTTGNSHNNTVQQVIDVAHTNILSKPVEFDKLLQLINTF